MSTEYKCVSCGKLVQYYKVAEFIDGTARSAVCTRCAEEEQGDDALEMLLDENAKG